MAYMETAVQAVLDNVILFDFFNDAKQYVTDMADCIKTQLRADQVGYPIQSARQNTQDKSISQNLHYFYTFKSNAASRIP